jgi:hypothetical protein
MNYFQSKNASIPTTKALLTGSLSRFYFWPYRKSKIRRGIDNVATFSTTKKRREMEMTLSASFLNRRNPMRVIVSQITHVSVFKDL